MRPNLGRFAQMLRQMRSGAEQGARFVGKGAKDVWQRGGPVTRGAIVGSGVGFGWGMSNWGRKYKAKDMGTRVRRGVRSAGAGALGGAAVGGLYEIGKYNTLGREFRRPY